MGYINFKEENYIGIKEVNLRKRKNKESIDYKYINDISIGNNKVLREDEFIKISNQDMSNVYFKNCTFNNIHFKNCKFIGTKFDNCKFDNGGVIFDDCEFTQEKGEFLNKYDNLGSEFINCRLYVSFINSNLPYSIFENCRFEDSYFEKCNLKNTIIIDSYIKKNIFKDVNFSSAKVIKTYITELMFEDEDKTKFDESTYFDKIDVRYKTKEEYKNLYEVYQIIGDKFKENSFNNNFGEYYYLGKCIQRKCIKTTSKIFSYLYYFTCGYGERPIHSVIFSICIIMIFSFIYLFTGIDVNGEVIKYTFSDINSLDIKELMTHINESLNLSIGLFGGVGFINSKPMISSYIVANIEMLIGIVMIGISIGTISRKIIK